MNNDPSIQDGAAALTASRQTIETASPVIVPRTSDVRIYLVERHSLLRESLQIMLEMETDFRLLGAADNAEQALAELDVLDADVALMDAHLTRMSGVEATRALKQRHPNLKVIVLASDSDDHMEDAFEAGATSYLLKSCTRRELVQAIRETAHGKTAIDPSLTYGLVQELIGLRRATRASTLTPRQVEILRLVSSGVRYQEIARQLFVSKSTVNRETRAIFDKLGVNDVAQAIYEASRRHLI